MSISGGSSVSAAEEVGVGVAAPVVVEVLEAEMEGGADCLGVGFEEAGGC